MRRNNQEMSDWQSENSSSISSLDLIYETPPPRFL